MSKTWGKAALFIISMVLGIAVMTQLKISQNVMGSDSSIGKTEADLNNEIAKLNSEKNQLREELDKLKAESSENEKSTEEMDEQLRALEEELNKQKILSGYYDVKGPGAIIKISSQPGAYVSLAGSHQYILALISYLNNAGVEAISINGQRYTNYTEIVPVLDHINVNGVALVLPIEIKAIGNSRTIDASLNFVGGIVSQMTSIGFTIDTEFLDEIYIGSYKGEKQFKYAVPIESNER
jgi:uncharacterized protein YlxW (UPF0749 family)